ncbi:MAG: histidinol-phosphate transaminase [Verrucomicrobia bacterium]|nr:histidinol-phosphate transaminase [Verrucomicrobiota bacterium]
MSTPTDLNRRQWLKTAAVGVAGLAVASNFASTPLAAQPAPASGKAEPSKINGNENPYGPSPLAVAAMIKHAPRAFRYATVDEANELTALIAKGDGVAPANVVVGSGSAEILENYAKLLSASGTGEVICATPGYLKFTEAMKKLGSKIIAVPVTKDMVHDLEAMAAKVGPATKCVYICNPNNPTGTIVEPEKLKAFCIEISKKCPVFVDEAYLECSDKFEANTMAPLVAAGHNVIVARTFSKVYGLAGQRVGYGLLPLETAKAIQAYNEARLNLLGVMAAIASLKEKTYVADTRAKIKAERDKLCATFDELKLTYAKPQGNFVFFRTGMPIKVFQEKMLAGNVLVGRAFPPAVDWCRISIGTPEEMAPAHAALRKIFKAS